MSTQKPTERNRQILGFSLPPELAREVKAEAAQRGLSLRRLFQELWQDYRKGQTVKVKK